MNSANKHGLRFLPEEPLPPYTYVPGKQPHPESDPAGHSYGRARAPANALDPTNWRASDTFLRGLDLFHCGFYWESHVEFERLWLAGGRKGPVADFLKALIHLAAAGVKALEGRAEGVVSHARRTKELLKGAQRESFEIPGFSLAQLIDLANWIARSGWPDSPPVLVSDVAAS